MRRDIIDLNINRDKDKTNTQQKVSVYFLELSCIHTLNVYTCGSVTENLLKLHSSYLWHSPTIG